MKEGKAYIGDEIVEGNKIICEFMGGKKFMAVWYYVGPDGFEHESGTHLKYHSSWDWLMPVFREWITRAVNLRNSNPELNEDFKEFKLCLEHFIVCVDLQKAHITLAKAIKWYNQNKQS